MQRDFKTDAVSRKAYQYLYQSILSGSLPLGAPVSELAVAEELGISRSPVREALRRMEAEGLISHFPGRGAFVTDITQQDIVEIFDLRMLLELHALSTACQHIPDDLLRQLEQDFLQLSSDSPEQAFYDANHRLHSTIVAFGGNRRLEDFFRMLSAQFAIVNRISAQDPAHFPHSRERHLEIVRALLDRDFKRAARALSTHLEEVRESTLRDYRVKQVFAARADGRPNDI